ncbi:MAG: tRNA preQ1(34) S-adenosylmethionine ribosyltransferase-isomerase QueA [Thermodesulfobacteriota bacterium]|nr:MAG: tRNA preQ1(34) S-adenosylmethionine ribosyltransferase-isomerase QueA [Candidatus Dadabacteria bacterium]
MNLSSYNFYLPDNLIASRPKKPRGTSRLLVVNRNSNEITISTFDKLLDFFNPNDLFVFNDTKVEPVYLVCKDYNGSTKSFLLIKELDNKSWQVLTKNPKEKEFILPDSSICFLSQAPNSRDWVLTFKSNVREIISLYGRMPLPPYIKREPDKEDFIDYQTVFARFAGSIAAPTAGLHFSKDILRNMASMNIETDFLTLHVGMGTFLPIKTEDLDNHKMHKERFYIKKSLISKIRKKKDKGERIVTVGTTSLRALEAYCINKKQSGEFMETDLFIKEDFSFKLTDSLLTNFHLPKSTLLVLVSSFLGYELTKKCYEIAVKEKFHFFSYGDAMLIL